MENLKLRVFLDTNVLVDVLNGPSRPAYQFSTKIIQAARSGCYEAFITTQSIIDAEFLCKHTPGSEMGFFYKNILMMMDFINVEAIDSFDISEALRNPDGDFEDSAQFSYAAAKLVDIIVTSDRKFINKKRFSGLVFLTPEEFVVKMESAFFRNVPDHSSRNMSPQRIEPFEDNPIPITDEFMPRTEPGMPIL